MSFRPGWFIYPHTGIAIIVLSESELAEQEAVMGNGEFIREAIRGEIEYQTSGILLMLAEYHTLISRAPIESTGITGLAS